MTAVEGRRASKIIRLERIAKVEHAKVLAYDIPVKLQPACFYSGALLSQCSCVIMFFCIVDLMLRSSLALSLFCNGAFLSQRPFVAALFSAGTLTLVRFNQRSFGLALFWGNTLKQP